MEAGSFQNREDPAFALYEDSARCLKCTYLLMRVTPRRTHRRYVVLSLPAEAPHKSPYEAMGFFAKSVSARNVQRTGNSERPAKQMQNLVHIFVFDSSDEGLHKPRKLDSLVRSVIPESLAYSNVPVSLFIDSNMPSNVGHGMACVSESVAKYAFAWKKIEETDPLFAEALRPCSESYTFSCEEYERGRGHRGVVLAIYELLHDVKNSSGNSTS